jgi:L-alanine-DL-glutamate epimerase-like enolase superfamily enzyme
MTWRSPDRGNTALGLAANLHLTPTPYIDEIITEPFKPDAEGLLTVPERPGLGVELNREALKRYGI